MKRKCIINNCSEEGKNKQHVFSGQIKVRKSLKPDFPYICPKHERELNKAMREIKKDGTIPLNSSWVEVGTVGDTTIWGRKKLIDLSAGTFCSIDDNLWELSVEKSKDVYVDQMKDWYLFKSEDKVRLIAYAIRLETGTTY